MRRGHYYQEIHIITRQETVTSATTVTTVRPPTLHEANEDGQVVEEAKVEQEKKYDTDSDTENPIADNEDEDSLKDLVFLQTVTTRSGQSHPSRVIQVCDFRYAAFTQPFMILLS